MFVVTALLLFLAAATPSVILGLWLLGARSAAPERRWAFQAAAAAAFSMPVAALVWTVVMMVIVPILFGGPEARGGPLYAAWAFAPCAVWAAIIWWLCRSELAAVLSLLAGVVAAGVLAFMDTTRDALLFGTLAVPWIWLVLVLPAATVKLRRAAR